MQFVVARAAVCGDLIASFTLSNLRLKLCHAVCFKAVHHNNAGDAWDLFTPLQPFINLVVALLLDSLCSAAHKPQAGSRRLVLNRLPDRQSLCSWYPLVNSVTTFFLDGRRSAAAQGTR